MDYRQIDPLEIDRLWRSLRKDLRRRGADPQTAEDIAQDAWLIATRRSPQEQGLHGGWLHVVAARLLYRARERESSRARRELFTARRAGPYWPESPRDGESSLLRRFVKDLPDPYRKVVVLRFYEGRTVADIAAELSLPGATVRTHLKRGLARLRARARSLDERRGLWALVPWLFAWPRRRSERRRDWRRPMIGASLVSLGVLCAWLSWAPLGWSGPSPATDGTTIASADSAAFSSTATILRAVAADQQAVRTTVASAAPAAGLLASPSADPVAPVVPVRVLLRKKARPVAGATVRVASENLQHLSCPGVTDERGEVDVTLREFPVWIWADHEGHSSTQRRLVDRGFVESGATLVLETLMEGWLQGAVADDQGRPVPGARVVIDLRAPRTVQRDAQGLLVAQPPSSVTTTDADGRFAAPAMAARFRVTASADGFETRTSEFEARRESIHLTLSHADGAGSSAVPEKLESAEVSVETLTWTEPLPEQCVPEAGPPEPASSLAESGAIQGRLRTSTKLRGSLPELRLDGDDPVSLRRCKCDDQGDFEFNDLPPGNYTVSVEAGGAHGAWTAVQFDLAPGERRDLGVLIPQAPGSVFVRVLPARPGDEGPVEFSLVGQWTRTSASYVTGGLGIEIDRVASTIAIRAVWPGAYRLVVNSGGRVGSAACEVLDGGETELDVKLDSTRVVVLVKASRPLRQGEKWSVFFHSSNGVTELATLPEMSHPFPAGGLRLDLGIPLESERIEVRTSLGLAGGFQFSQPPVPNSTIDIELR